MVSKLKFHDGKIAVDSVWLLSLSDAELLNYVNYLISEINKLENQLKDIQKPS